MMSSHVLTILGYLLVLLAGVAVQAAAVRSPGRIPPLGAVLTRAMRTRTGRVGVLVAWAWLGLHFFAR